MESKFPFGTIESPADCDLCITDATHAAMSWYESSTREWRHLVRRGDTIERYRSDGFGPPHDVVTEPWPDEPKI